MVSQLAFFSREITNPKSFPARRSNNKTVITAVALCGYSSADNLHLPKSCIFVETHLLPKLFEMFLNKGHNMNIVKIETEHQRPRKGKKEINIL